MSTSGDRPTPELDVPVAVPLGSELTPMKSQVSRLPRQIRETKTPASTEPDPPVNLGSRGRYGGLQLRRRAAELSNRDHRVLHLLATQRFLTSRQLQRFAFADHASSETAERLCRRVLNRLRRDHLIQPLHRRVGGVRAGSSATVWQLSPAGARITFDDSKRHRPSEPSPRLRDHCLAIADAHLTIRDLAGLDGIDDTTVDLEPTCWRRYTGLGGDPRWLQPDLHTTVLSHDEQGDLEDRWFIEVDCGTESLPTLIRKCLQYEEYRASGIEQAETSGTFPLVLWIFHGPKADRRADQLRAQISRDKRLTDALYRFACPETLSTTLATGGQS